MKILAISCKNAVFGSFIHENEVFEWSFIKTKFLAVLHWNKVFDFAFFKNKAINLCVSWATSIQSLDVWSSE
jgi:hypothetical protein